MYYREPSMDVNGEKSLLLISDFCHSLDAGTMIGMRGEI